MELVIGQLVTSRRGRDVTKSYLVTGMEGQARSGRQRLLLCDGGKWPLSAPKPKNPSHVQPVNRVLPPGQWETDSQIKAALKAYDAERAWPKQGG